jgi:hypothetical protein
VRLIPGEVAGLEEAYMRWNKPTFKIVAATLEVTAYMGKR